MTWPILINTSVVQGTLLRTGVPSLLVLLLLHWDLDWKTRLIISIHGFACALAFDCVFLLAVHRLIIHPFNRAFLLKFMNAFSLLTCAMIVIASR